MVELVVEVGDETVDWNRGREGSAQLPRRRPEG